MPTYTIFCCIAKKKDKNKTKSPTPREKFDILGYQPILEDHDRTLISQSGRIIFTEKHLERKAVPFLIEFFKAYPEHQKYFKAFRDTPPEELLSLPVVENHGRKVMDEMKVLVNHVNDPMKMKEIIWDLTFSHRNRRVRPLHLKDMLFTFVQFVKAELGKEFTAEMEVSWKKFVVFIMAIVEDEEVKASTTPRNTIDDSSDINQSVRDHQSGVDYKPSAADHTSSVADHRSSVADHKSSVADHKSSVADHKSSVADHKSDHQSSVGPTRI
ncbi:hypothetical protein Btru_066568 [Bulinus truncatus]|nr:hypothetical protein Btru_066568 [Bulinus truncatus]